MLTDVFILGATGFVGCATVEAALEAGLSVGAWARTEAQAAVLRRRGVRGVAPPWISATKGVIDLIQPNLPRRLTEGGFIRAARDRAEVTRSVRPALPRGAVYFLVSGTDDFERGTVSHRSPFTARPSGFARIGLSVRSEMLTSGIPFASLHLGTVYGPGKAFASTVFPRLAKGRLPVVGDGSNRLPLIHVEDAGRAILHLVHLEESRVLAHPWIVTDGAATAQRALVELGARLLGAPAPRSVPRWLASLFAGSVGAALFARDVPTDSSALLSAGFTLRYPSIATGLPATLASLEAA